MLTFQEEQRVRKLIHEETDDIRKTVNSTAVNVDKILKIVTTSNQEHVLTKTKVSKLEKRMVKVEGKINIKSPSTSTVFS